MRVAPDGAAVRAALPSPNNSEVDNLAIYVGPNHEISICTDDFIKAPAVQNLTKEHLKKLLTAGTLLANTVKNDLEHRRSSIFSRLFVSSAPIFRVSLLHPEGVAVWLMPKNIMIDRKPHKRKR